MSRMSNRVALTVRLDPEDKDFFAEHAERCGIEPSTFSHLLSRLCKLGYVTRSRPEDDNRAVVVALTPAGRRIVRKCIGAVQGHHDVLAQTLTEQEQCWKRQEKAKPSGHNHPNG